jgi:hypothetical protein
VKIGAARPVRAPRRDDQRRQAKRNTLADEVPVEAKALADLKVEKARWRARKVEAELGLSSM